MSKTSKKEEEKTTLKNWKAVDKELCALAEQEALWASRQRKYDDACLAVKRKHAEGIQEAKDAVARKRRNIELFVEANRKDLVDNKIELSMGSVYYKNTKAAVHLLSDAKDAIKEVISKIVKSIKWGKKLLRISPELDKNSILKAYNDGSIEDNELKEFGLEVKTGEKLYIEAKPLSK